jgi:hypothetical protein
VIVGIGLTERLNPASVARLGKELVAEAREVSARLAPQ